MVIKPLLKRITHAFLAAYGALRLKCGRHPRLIILTYHRVLPKQHPERAAEQPGMIVSPENLFAHLKVAKQLGAEFVHLDDWVKQNEQGTCTAKLSVAVTFDDGWRDNYVHAYPVLKSAGLPFTIFLVSRMVDSDDVFWPEQVLKLLTSYNLPFEDKAFQWLTPFIDQPATQGAQTPLTLSQADEVVARLKYLDDATILGHLEQIYEHYPAFTPSPSSRSILNADELNEMSCSGLARYGAHTRNHYRLNRLNDYKLLNEEIVGCYEDIKKLNSASVPIFCYPNGDISEQGEHLVSKHYNAACTIKTGWNRAGCNPFDLKRFNLHDGNSHSPQQFLATIGRGLL